MHQKWNKIIKGGSEMEIEKVVPLPLPRKIKNGVPTQIFLFSYGTQKKIMDVPVLAFVFENTFYYYIPQN